MKILYLGDIMGEPGIGIVARLLPGIKQEHQPDLIIAQSENVSSGKGMLPEDMKRLQAIGIDFFTGGNHTPAKKELNPLLEDSKQPVIGPANLVGCPGKGWKYFQTAKGPVLLISLMGSKVGTEIEFTNPLQAIDGILEASKGAARVATIINFHGDFSSEKRIMGYYLDGRVSAVIGDHWHVPTADAMVLPKGTAHITDVGMCGSLHSSLGVKLDTVITRWRDSVINKNELETEGAMQLNAVLIETDSYGLSKSIHQIQHVLQASL